MILSVGVNGVSILMLIIVVDVEHFNTLKGRVRQCTCDDERNQYHGNPFLNNCGYPYGLCTKDPCEHGPKLNRIDDEESSDSNSLTDCDSHGDADSCVGTQICQVHNCIKRSVVYCRCNRHVVSNIICQVGDCKNSTSGKYEITCKRPDCDLQAAFKTDKTLFNVDNKNNEDSYGDIDAFGTRRPNYCQVPRCVKRVVKNSRCNRHSADAIVCQVGTCRNLSCGNGPTMQCDRPDCDTDDQDVDYEAGYDSYGDIDAPRAPEPTICQVPNCDEEIKDKLRCYRHADDNIICQIGNCKKLTSKWGAFQCDRPECDVCQVEGCIKLSRNKHRCYRHVLSNVICQVGDCTNLTSGKYQTKCLKPDCDLDVSFRTDQ